MNSAMATTTKPITLDDVVFVVATPEQREKAWRINHASWAKGAPLDEHLRREATLAATTHGTSPTGGRTYFVVHRKNNPLDIVCAVSSLGKQALVKDADGVRVVRAYGVGDVHTAPEYRKQGMAGHMLRNLQEAIDTNGEFSVLYSGIGTEYYGKFGWAAYPSLQVSIYLDGGKPEQPADIKFLSQAEMGPYCERDVAAQRQRMENMPADGRTHVAFLPTFEQLDWQFTRDALAAQLRGDPEPTYYGAATADDRCWVYWHHDANSSMLVIHRVVADSSNAVQDLLRAAMVEADQYGLERVVSWNPEGEVEDGARLLGEDGVRVRFENRENSRSPCLRWRGGAEKDVVWDENHHYAWC